MKGLIKEYNQQMADFLEKGFISEVLIRGRCILRVVERGFKGGAYQVGAYQVGADRRKKLSREGAFLERGPFLRGG